MVDDLIAAIEGRDRMSPPMSMRAAMEILVKASTTGVIDSEVLRARYKLARCLAAKPSTTGAGKELGLKLSKAVRGRVGRSSK